MIKWLKRIFSSKNTKEFVTIYIPKAGDEYYFKNTNDKSPFPKKKYKDNPITILDCRDEWVNYQMGSSNPPFNDERMELSMFLRMYKKLEPESIL